VAPEAKILAFRACRQIAENDPRGRGNTVSVTRAVDAALNRKAGIVNMSIGAAAADRLIALLIAEGARRGMWFVAPVGNREDLAAPTFPASCEAVVGVGGVKENGGPFPNRAVAGAATACAPCENLLTTIPGNRYNFLDGASLSAAVVSGVLALAMEKGPVPRKEEWPSECGDIRRWTEAVLGIPSSE
jgi:subtilisin